MLDDIAMWNGSGAQVLVGSEPEQVETLMVTTDSWRGDRSDGGRRFTAADDAPEAPATVMLTHVYWQRTFGVGPAAHDGRVG